MHIAFDTKSGVVSHRVSYLSYIIYMTRMYVCIKIIFTNASLLYVHAAVAANGQKRKKKKSCELLDCFVGAGQGKRDSRIRDRVESSNMSQPRRSCRRPAFIIIITISFFCSFSSTRIKITVGPGGDKINKKKKKRTV